MIFPRVERLFDGPTVRQRHRIELGYSSMVWYGMLERLLWSHFPRQGVCFEVYNGVVWNGERASREPVHLKIEEMCMYPNPNPYVLTNLSSSKTQTLIS